MRQEGGAFPRNEKLRASLVGARRCYAHKGKEEGGSPEAYPLVALVLIPSPLLLPIPHILLSKEARVVVDWLSRIKTAQSLQIPMLSSYPNTVKLAYRGFTFNYSTHPTSQSARHLYLLEALVFPSLFPFLGGTLSAQVGWGIIMCSVNNFVFPAILAIWFRSIMGWGNPRVLRK